MTKNRIFPCLCAFFWQQILTLKFLVLGNCLFISRVRKKKKDHLYVYVIPSSKILVGQKCKQHCMYVAKELFLSYLKRHIISLKSKRTSLPICHLCNLLNKQIHSQTLLAVPLPFALWCRNKFGAFRISYKCY